ncbi:MAG: CDP-alcohol phosphatidyltransferase family protein [Planctomycetes bacterium]|nr:CDP-alcohol phosphatidyltransferase family protein [Planctomycetota bacterium]
MSSSCVTVAQPPSRGALAPVAFILIPAAGGTAPGPDGVGPEDSLFRVALWRRAVLTCDRGGYPHVILVSPRGAAPRAWLHPGNPPDSRRAALSAVSATEAALLAPQTQGLIMDWNVVLQPGLLERLRHEVDSDAGEGFTLLDAQGEPVGLAVLPGAWIREFFLGRHASVQGWVRQELERGSLRAIRPGSKDFCRMLHHRCQVREAERRLLQGTRARQRHFMDRHVNSVISTRISWYLARTSLTPNQVTLFGLPMAIACFVLFARGETWASIVGSLMLVFTAVWDCCDGELARLKFQESQIGETLDLAVDNAINLAAFLGLAWGLARDAGIARAASVTAILLPSGFLIFLAIYFPRSSGKSGRFCGTVLEPVVHHLVNRDFLYLILAFSLVQKPYVFLYVAAAGSAVFALVLWCARLWPGRTPSALFQRMREKAPRIQENRG